jgi:hypothetical protein
MRVGPLRFAGAIDGYPAGGVGNIANQWFGAWDRVRFW